MKFEELLVKYQQEKKKVFINGMPEEDGGTIEAIEEDYLVFKIVNNKEKQEDCTEETVIIQKKDITTLSEGEKKIGTLCDTNATSPETKKEEVASVAQVAQTTTTEVNSEAQVKL